MSQGSRQRPCAQVWEETSRLNSFNTFPKGLTQCLIPIAPPAL